MDNFVYCYLSPFLVGLLAFIAIAVGVGVVFFIWYHIEEWYRYGVTPYSKVGRVLSTTGHWMGRVLLGLFVLFFVTTLSFGAWATGIDILKRFVCK